MSVLGAHAKKSEVFHEKCSARKADVSRGKNACFRDFSQQNESWQFKSRHLLRGVSGVVSTHTTVTLIYVD